MLVIIGRTVIIKADICKKTDSFSGLLNGLIRSDKTPNLKNDTAGLRLAAGIFNAAFRVYHSYIVPACFVFAGAVAVIQYNVLCAVINRLL